VTRKIYLRIGAIAAVTMLTVVWQAGVASKVRTAAAILLDEGPSGLARKITGQPSVPWESVAPKSRGLDPARLEGLIDRLRSQSTDVFLLARGGAIVAEWYAPDREVNTQFAMAAMAKAVTGSMALLLTLSDGRVELDDRIAEHYAGWRQDSRKSQITIRQLASHSSGLDDVDFSAVGGGWKRHYYQNTKQRFQLALERAPLLFDPGERQLYSGLGYYVLAYVITKSRRGLPEDDLESLLRARLFEPLGIPRRAWSLSYGESYEFDGLQLYAIGSGASITARAAARIGQLVLDRGKWQGEQLIPANWVDTLRSLGPLAAERRLDPTELGAGLGWWMNSDGLVPSLPRDAMVGVGNGDRVLLVVPSLDLVMVRSGGLLAPAEGVAIWKNPWNRLDEHLFGPLMAVVESNALSEQ
jgi:CubicO group peptidase (beta-lactamase class C family)